MWSRVFLPDAIFSIASPVLPSGPPSLLPFPTIELLLAQLAVDFIMSLAHPPA